MMLFVLVSFCVSSCAIDYSERISKNSLTDSKNSLKVLKQDSGLNLSDMNISLVVTPTYASGQTVRFTAPYTGWILKYVLISASDGWNGSDESSPKALPFAIEILDANLSVLHHFSDTQLAYFTNPSELRTASIDIPDTPINGDFFISFYGYRSIGIAAELENATGNSYYYDKISHGLYPADILLKDNSTVPINFIIRAAGR